MESFSHFEGQIVDIVKRKIFPGKITIENGKIRSIVETNTSIQNFILPGLVDAHVHIESSMLIPSQFARLAVKHGVVATVSDPHEIANVNGLEGIKYMINNGKSVPFKFYFGAPSCVPATNFETTGFIIDSAAIGELLENKEILYLSEMMNYPGVIHQDVEVMKKIGFAKKRNKPIDGHAPLVCGENLQKYISSGISTDHECSTLDEAIEKIKFGMKILIREGSAAKNFEELKELIKIYPQSIMFCTDDCHPDDFLKEYINTILHRSLNYGYDFFDALRACTFNPVHHYKLDVGLLQIGDPADFILVDSLDNLHILKTFINGQLVYDNDYVLFNSTSNILINNFNCNPIFVEDIKVPYLKSEGIRVIEAIEGQLLTKQLIAQPKIENGFVISDIEQDILKLVVVNRFNYSLPSVGFIKNFGIKHGAIASTIAHDSHNIIAIGANDEELISAINRLIEIKGGIVVFNNSEILELQLPVSGLMSLLDGNEVAEKYSILTNQISKMGSTLKAPLMSLAFMALLVIPELKLSDKGLFNGNEFKFVSLFI